MLQAHEVNGMEQRLNVMEVRRNEAVEHASEHEQGPLHAVPRTKAAAWEMSPIYWVANFVGTDRWKSRAHHKAREERKARRAKKGSKYVDRGSAADATPEEGGMGAAAD